MRVLILSDTHGNLHLINKFARKAAADVVLHCGDFSFYLEDRLDFSPDRELALRIRHSPLPNAIKKRSFSMRREEKLAIVKEHHLEGEFQLYVEGKEKFEVPLYVAYGNHEDQEVIRQLKDGTIKVPNLHLVDESSDIVLGEGKSRIRIVGIGGNFIHFTFFDREWSDQYYPSMRFVQWIRLLKRFPRVERPEKPAAPKGGKQRKGKEKEKEVEGEPAKVERGNQERIPLWVMTHVSPGKIPAMELFSTYMHSPLLWFSGHMGPYIPQHYSMFTFNDDYEFAERTRQDVGFLLQYFHKMLPLWELWATLEKLLPFDKKEQDITFILERQKAQKAASSSSSSSDVEPAVYSSFAEFPADIVRVLGLDQEGMQPSDGEEAVEGKEKEKETEPTQTKRGDLSQSGDVVSLPEGVRARIRACRTPAHLAETIRYLLYIEPHLTRTEKQQITSLLSKEELKEHQRNHVAAQFPFPGSIPTAEELQLMKDNLHYLQVPFPVPKGALDIENRPNRVPSDHVKRMPMYFNLSDAYQGGYIVIDVNQQTGKMDIQLQGTYPPPETVVDPADNPWLKHDRATKS